MLSRTRALNIQQWLGATGALLAFAILAASIMLRLTTLVEEDGLRSSLPSEIENLVRMVHRVSASGVGLLALVVTGIAWTQRRRAPYAVSPVAWLVAATLLLAAIGPLTPGYRYISVTIANVVAGTVLLSACWWLREILAWGPRDSATRCHPLLRTTIVVFAAHVGMGAAASAFEMRGVHWVAFVHSGTGMLTAMLLGSVLWDRRGEAKLTRIVNMVGCTLALQFILGLVSLWVEGRPVVLSFVHALFSPVLAGGLVSLAVRDGSIVMAGSHDTLEA